MAVAACGTWQSQSRHSSPCPCIHQGQGHQADAQGELTTVQLQLVIGILDARGLLDTDNTDALQISGTYAYMLGFPIPCPPLPLASICIGASRESTCKREASLRLIQSTEIIKDGLLMLRTHRESHRIALYDYVSVQAGVSRA